MSSQKHRAKFVTLPNGEYHGTYELKETIEGYPPDDTNHRPACRCCGGITVPAFDVMQMGFWQDRCQTYFICPVCKTAVLFDYTMSRIEPAKRRKGVK